MNTIVRCLMLAATLLAVQTAVSAEVAEVANQRDMNPGQRPALVGPKFVRPADESRDAASPLHCAKFCEERAGCTAWQMHFGDRGCEMYLGDAGDIEDHGGYVLGYIYFPPTP